jgi:hypothetical protein
MQRQQAQSASQPRGTFVSCSTSLSGARSATDEVLRSLRVTQKSGHFQAAFTEDGDKAQFFPYLELMAIHDLAANGMAGTQ